MRHETGNTGARWGVPVSEAGRPRYIVAREHVSSDGPTWDAQGAFWSEELAEAFCKLIQMYDTVYVYKILED